MGGRILVVDDNREAANALARLLAVLNHDVRVAYGGCEAIEIGAEFRFDMAFVDLGMPDLNGHETVARLRQARGSSDVVMVALTGWSREASKTDGHANGFNFHVMKPMSEETLNRLLALLAPERLE